MNQEDIERSFVEAGWELDGSFSGHLAVGEKDYLSILAYRRTWESGVLTFELCDGEKEVVCQVWVIPTPQEAAVLLNERGEPSDVVGIDPTLSVS